jgi:hypothetical protein
LITPGTIQSQAPSHGHRLVIRKWISLFQHAIIL